MNEIYINAKNFKNDDISIMFVKDLISVEELVDKIYELKDILKETQEQLEKTQENLKYSEMELTSAKLGFTPYD